MHPNVQQAQLGSQVAAASPAGLTLIAISASPSFSSNTFFFSAALGLDLVRPGHCTGRLLVPLVSGTAVEVVESCIRQGHHKRVSQAPYGAYAYDDHPPKTRCALACTHPHPYDPRASETSKLAARHSQASEQASKTRHRTVLRGGERHGEAVACVGVRM